MFRMEINERMRRRMRRFNRRNACVDACVDASTTMRRSGLWDNVFSDVSEIGEE